MHGRVVRGDLAEGCREVSEPTSVIRARFRTKSLEHMTLKWQDTYNPNLIIIVLNQMLTPTLTPKLTPNLTPTSIVQTIEFILELYYRCGFILVRRRLCTFETFFMHEVPGPALRLFASSFGLRHVVKFGLDVNRRENHNVPQK